MPIFKKIEFLVHFWQYGSVTFFGLGQKTRSDFFHKTMTFDFLSSQFWWAETYATLMTQTLFSDFVIRVCRGGILKMVDFDHLGYDLNHWFFGWYRKFYSDLPSSYSVPLTLIPWPCMNHAFFMHRGQVQFGFWRQKSVSFCAAALWIEVLQSRGALGEIHRMC